MTMTNIPQVLDTKETLAGQQELFDTQDENEEDVNDDVDEEEDDELGSDVEMDDAEAEADGQAGQVFAEQNEPSFHRRKNQGAEAVTIKPELIGEKLNKHKHPIVKNIIL